jgi:hypothetical protein
MKKILALNKEEDGLKLIQVNDGFVVVDVNNKDFKKDEDALYRFWKIGVVTDVNENVLKFEGKYIHESHLTKMIFATPNLNLEGVPIIEEKENILDTYIQIIGDNKIQSINNFLKNHNKDLFTEEQIREAIKIASGERLIDKENQIKNIIQFLKQPKVEIEFEENQCDGCIAGYPIENGVHKVSYPSDPISCQKEKYNKPIRCIML